MAKETRKVLKGFVDSVAPYERINSIKQSVRRLVQGYKINLGQVVLFTSIFKVELLLS